MSSGKMCNEEQKTLHANFHSTSLLKNTHDQSKHQKIRLIVDEDKAKKSLDNGIAFPVKPFLRFKLNGHSHLFAFLQDFYFTRVIHDQVSLLVDFRWLIQKEENVFTCSEIGPDGRLRFDSASHPQTFYKKCMRTRIHNEPFVVVLKKKSKEQ